MPMSASVPVCDFTYCAGSTAMMVTSRWEGVSTGRGIQRRRVPVLGSRPAGMLRVSVPSQWMGLR